ncbi:hypothetical protein THRCLA_00877 [Thraustotheca clavata]|uniref:BRCT domain-containing protein n=1 Tax=Thraustotheca clavata TaxID=74557 RepID=A0A1W0AAA4_9STRA|nr:hypothetical protein THRCLA_00877 [Thraustotheca clavata]
METAMDVLERFVEAEEAIVHALCIGRVKVLRVELRLQRFMKKCENLETILPSFPCLVLIPQLFEAHRAILNGLNKIKTLAPTLSDRARTTAQFLYDQAQQFKSLHALYAWYHQSMPTQCDREIEEMLQLPLESLEMYAVCMDALAPFAERIEEWQIMCDSLHDAFSDTMAQRTRAMDMLALEEGLGNKVELLERKLVAQNVLSILLQGAQVQNGTLYLFEDLCLVVDTNGLELFKVEATQMCKAILIPDTSNCLLLTQDAHCTIFANPTVVSSLLLSINETFLSPKPKDFSFDLSSILHSMEDIPTDWLVTNTECAQESLVRSDVMWLWEKDIPPRLCQFFLLKDMILFGHILGLTRCQYLDHILGEYVEIRNQSNDTTLELVITHAETQTESNMILLPLDASAIQPWVELIATFSRVLAPLSLDSSVTTLASTATTMASPVLTSPFVSPKPDTWIQKKLKSRSSKVIASEPIMSFPNSPKAQPLIESITPATTEELVKEKDIPSVTQFPVELMHSDQRKEISLLVQPPDELVHSDSESFPNNFDKPVLQPEPERMQIVDKVDPPVVSPKVAVVLEENVVPEEKDAKAKTKKAKPATAKKVTKAKRERLEVPQECVLETSQISPKILTKPVKGKKRKIKTSLTSAEEKAPAKVSRVQSVLERLPPSTQEMEGRAIECLLKIAEAPALTPQKLRIVLTGFEEADPLLFKIAAIENAEYEEDVMNATHIISPRDTFKRTVKILCGISRCLHILDDRWLDSSAELGYPAQERDYCLKDPAKEELYGFTLERTMYEFSLHQRQNLLRGYSFYIANHKSIRPPPTELSKIIQCAGGEMVKGLPQGETIVIASKEAVATATIQKQLLHMNRSRCFNVEFLLLGILQQTLHWQEFQVHCPLPKKILR